MQNDLYFYIMVFGVILIGFAWVLPKRGSKGEGHGVNNLPDNTVRLLSEMKRDMEQKMTDLSRQVQELRTEMENSQLQASTTATSAGEGKQHGLKLNQRYAEIFELLHKGLSQEEIARTLDMGTGEVSMIIGLQRMTSTPQRSNDPGGSRHE